MRSMRSREISPIAGMNSRIVPSCSLSTRAIAMSSSSDAVRAGTVWPSPSMCASSREPDHPSAPASMAAWSIRAIVASCSSVASCSTAAAPIAARRSVECPTRKPALMPSLPSKRLRKSPKESQSQGRERSVSRGMPSTTAIISMM